MKNHKPLLLLLCALPLLGGCVSTAAKIITAPVKVAGKAVDWTTTSQSEADEKRGREIRKREEELGKLDRQYQKNMRKCQNGDEKACQDAREDYAQMERVRPTVPYEGR